MKAQDILEQIRTGEGSRLQFKERIFDKYETGCELVAFSNSRGGKLIVGVKDKTGDINALSYSEAQETANLLGAIASGNVVPSILIEIETVGVDDGNLVIASIKEGINKPYHDNKGIVWVKNGADKRKVFDNSELAEMMTDCGSFEPDKAGIRDAVLDDLDEDTLKLYLSSKFDKVLHKKGISGDVFKEASLDEICSAIAKGHDAEHLLRNLHFIRPDGNLTLAAILLFGKYTQRWLPVMTAKCICFAGNSVGGKLFRDKVSDEDMEGNLLHQFNMIMNFYSRNLRTVQIGDEFNQQGRLEIPYTSLVEFTVNALIHRSLNQKAPVRIFIFDNRVEIHSPGALPNGLTVEDIVCGTSLPRNTFLFDNAIHLLPYTGAGSGIARAMNENLKVEFTNNEKLSEFLITIRREENNQVEEKAGQGVNLDTNYGDLGTKHRHSEGDLDTKHRHYTDDSDTKPRHFEGDPDAKIHHLDTQKKPLTNKQRDIINFCSVPRTTREILERIGVSMHTKNREHYIKPLVEAGYLQMTNPDNPTASNQKYRKACS